MIGSARTQTDTYCTHSRIHNGTPPNTCSPKPQGEWGWIWRRHSGAGGWHEKEDARWKSHKTHRRGGDNRVDFKVPSSRCVRRPSSSEISVVVFVLVLASVGEYCCCCFDPPNLATLHLENPIGSKNLLIFLFSLSFSFFYKNKNLNEFLSYAYC